MLESHLSLAAEDRGVAAELQAALTRRNPAGMRAPVGVETTAPRPSAGRRGDDQPEGCSR